MESGIAGDQSTDRSGDPVTRVEVQLPKMVQDVTNASDVLVSEAESQNPTKSPKTGTGEAAPTDDSESPHRVETRASFARANASSPKRQRLAESCSGDENENPNDESYDPRASPSKKTNVKRIKVVNLTSNASQHRSSEQKSPPKPRAKKSSASSKRSSSENIATAQACGQGSLEGMKATLQRNTASITGSTLSTVPESATEPAIESRSNNGPMLSGQNSQQTPKTGMRMLNGKTPNSPDTVTEEESRMHPKIRAAFLTINKCVKAEWEDVEKVIMALEEREASANKKIRVLRSEKQKLQTDNASLSKMKPTESAEVVRLSTEILSLKTSQAYKRLRVTDDEISDLWGRVGHNIMSLSSQVAEGMVRSPKSGIQEPRFPFIIGQAVQAAPVSVDQCAALLRNWLWRYLIQSVIESDLGPWPASVSQAFVAYYRKLISLLDNEEVSPEFVSEVKSSNCCGILATHAVQEQRGFSIKEYTPSHNRDRLLRVRGNMMEDLNAFWDASEAECEEAEKLLGETINKSHRLGKYLLSSKALFRIGSLDPFTVPTALGETDTRPIQHIVVAPSLLKRGTADGDNFDQKTFLHMRESFEICRP